VFDNSVQESVFVVNATGASSTAFFTEHFPTEFEETDHYFKDTSGVDIEPDAQDPKPEVDGHSHGHGGPGEDTMGLCVCQSQKYGWRLDCTKMDPIRAAVDYLEATPDCRTTTPGKLCEQNYFFMQAHHDHCLHHQLPTDIEKTLHDYEDYYTDCFVKRQYDPDLSNCPAVDCNNAQFLSQAIQVVQGGCSTNVSCADSTCSAAIKTVLMSHDTCPEDKLPDNTEKALHDHEEPCAAQLCNSADAAFDPYDAKCVIDAVEQLAGVGGNEIAAAMSQQASQVLQLLLCLAVCMMSS